MSTIGDISYRTKWILSKRYMQAAIVITLMTLAIAIPLLKNAFAVTDIGNAGVFELDGNIVKNASTACPTDWGPGPGGSGVFTAGGTPNTPAPCGGIGQPDGWVNDGPHGADATTFTTGSKDILDIANAGWQCTPSNNLTPKDDILHAYSFAAINPFATSMPNRQGHTFLYAAFERFANNGAGDIGLWLLQDPTVGCSSTKGAVSFSGAHQVNDTLIVAEFSTGGSVTTLNAFRWTGSGLASITATGGADCTTSGSGDNFCAVSNAVSISTPWPTQDKTSGSNTLAPAEFLEIGIDLSAVYPSNLPCVNKFLFDTRTSPSTTATLMDYAIGSVVTCTTSSITTSVSPTPIALGSSASDTATVTNAISSFAVQGTVTFNAYASLSDCTAGTNSVFTDTKSVSGSSPLSVTSAPFTPTAPGTYYWIAAYAPASSRNGTPASTTCGDSNEILVVIGSSITTSVSPTPITLGGSATDTATVTVTSGGTVGGTVTFNAYASLSDCTAGTNSKFTDTKSVSGSSPLSVTSAPFTPTAAGTYYWIPAYAPKSGINGQSILTTCGDSNEILVVFGIPKITAFDFTNSPTNNDPTLGSGTVTYSFNIRNYGASAVTLSGTLAVSSPNGATVTCTGGNSQALSGSLAAFGSPGDSATFSMTCTYSGTSGQQVSVSIDAMFAVGGGVAHEVSGSPATYTFTIETT